MFSASFDHHLIKSFFTTCKYDATCIFLQNKQPQKNHIKEPNKQTQTNTFILTEAPC